MKLYDSISPELEEWVMKQPVFFSASAPQNAPHINVSPKGLPASSFRILSPNLCGYIDASGSGIETIANIYENGRVTLMFCLFATSPRILRFFCKGRVIEYDDPQFSGWHEKMSSPEVVGARAIIALDVFQVQTSCGFGVPYLAMKLDPQDAMKQIPYLEDRQTPGHWGNKQVAAGTLEEYRAQNNNKSLDGLPGLKKARSEAGEWMWLSDLGVYQYMQRAIINTVFVALISAFLTTVSTYMLGLTNLKNVA